MIKSNDYLLKYLAWGLSAIVIGIVVLVWGSGLLWNFNGISIYQIFPLLGLIAFSVMWSHYIISFLNKTIFKKTTLGLYYKVTGYIVLIAIIFHPGLLAFQRFRDGYGIPEKSLTSYVQNNLKWVVLLGTVSFLVFLLFELQRFYKEKFWWKYLIFANEIAMLAIFYHALRLGTNLHGGWFKYVWFFYGVTLIIIFSYYNYNRIISFISEKHIKI